MVTSQRRREATAQGHVAIYARDARWRRSVANALTESGHSRHEAASPEEIHRLLATQRFDVLALNVRDEADAQAVAEALTDVRLPHHGILVGHQSALALVMGSGRGATFRYVPGRPAGRQLSRLVDASISAGAPDDSGAEHTNGSQIEEVDLEEAIESAAAVVYPQAKRRRQRFATVVEGAAGRALGDPAKIKRVFVALLRLVVTHAPRGASVSVDARANGDEWTIRCQAVGGQRRGNGAALADALQEEAKTLSSAARDVQGQGGMLWVELTAARTALALCLTLPVPPEAPRAELT